MDPKSTKTLGFPYGPKLSHEVQNMPPSPHRASPASLDAGNADCGSVAGVQSPPLPTLGSRKSPRHLTQPPPPTQALPLTMAWPLWAEKLRDEGSEGSSHLLVCFSSNMVSLFLVSTLHLKWQVTLLVHLTAPCM